MSKGKAYSAEWRLCELFDHGGNVTVFGVPLVLPVERRFGSIDTVQRYADWVLRYVADTYPSTAGVTVVEGVKQLQKKAYHSGNQITLPQRQIGDWAWREIVVLHEIAHHLTKGHGHDAVFAGCLAHLLAEIVGPEAGWAYTVLLANEGMNIAIKETANV